MFRKQQRVLDARINGFIVCIVPELMTTDTRVEMLHDVPTEFVYYRICDRICFFQFFRKGCIAYFMLPLGAQKHTQLLYIEETKER